MPEIDRWGRWHDAGTVEQEIWARQFICERHGQMIYATVRTDKLCGVADPKGPHGHCCEGLIRGDVPNLVACPDCAGSPYWGKLLGMFGWLPCGNCGGLGLVPS